MAASLEQQVSREEVMDSAIGMALARVITRCRRVIQTEDSVEMIFYNDIHVKVGYVSGEEGYSRYRFNLLNGKRSACMDSYHEQHTGFITSDRVAYYLTNYAMLLGPSVMEEENAS